MMKRYWLFAGDRCYARGGMFDFQGSADTVEELRLVLNQKVLPNGLEGCCWHQILDSNNGKIVEWEGSAETCSGVGWFFNREEWHPDGQPSPQELSVPVRVEERYGDPEDYNE